MHVSAIIAAGGRGARFGGALPKQLLALAGTPVLQRSVDAFLRSDRISSIVVAVPQEVATSPPGYLRAAAKPLTIVEGGARRRDSVARAFAASPSATDIVVVHDAARPLVTPALIARAIDAAADYGAAVAALRASDTVKRVNGDGLVTATLVRDEIYLAQTPQAFRAQVLRDALAVEGDATDEAALAERAGHRVKVIEGDPRNLKITTPEDLSVAERLLGHDRPASMLRIGNGYDLHRLVAGRRLVLGGVSIPFEKGLAGHSDADAVCHAATDAILGACGAGDIGRHFPDSDPAWKGADSLSLLRRASAILRERGFAVVNLDIVVIAEAPKLAPHVAQMAANVAGALGIDPSQVSIKGKTNEGADSVGAGESIATHAVALIAQ